MSSDFTHKEAPCGLIRDENQKKVWEKSLKQNYFHKGDNMNTQVRKRKFIDKFVWGQKVTTKFDNERVMADYTA